MRCGILTFPSARREPILDKSTLSGLLCLGLALALLALGGWLARRYHRAAHYRGIGRGYPLSHGLLGSLGSTLLLLGLIVLMIACMLLFFTPG